MSDIPEAKWKKDLTFIVEELSGQQYEKLLEILDKIPKGQKEKSREKLPQIIIEHYGLGGSVSAIADAMEEIPRRDPKIQSLLQPFVKTKEEEKKSKRKTLDPQTEEETATASAVPVRSQSTMADQPTTRKSIRDLIASNESVLTDTIRGRVMKKSTLHTSSTKKYYFYVVLRDETASLDLMVYGKPHHQQIMEGKYYSFRKLLRGKDGKKAGQFIVTSDTIVSEIAPFTIPEEVEKEARQLCSKSPFYSIKDFKTLDSGTGSVKGTIIELNPCRLIPLKNQEKKTEKRQSFCIEDDTDAIEVFFWGDKTQQCTNLSVGDVIVLNNVKINRYYEKVSLQSTRTTNVEQVDKVGIRNKNIEIVGISEAQKRQTHLEVKLDQKCQTLIVASKLLAEAFGLTLGEDFQSQLVSALPVLAEALIDGNKIKKITVSRRKFHL